MSPIQIISSDDDSESSQTSLIGNLTDSQAVEDDTSSMADSGSEKESKSKTSLYTVLHLTSREEDVRKNKIEGRKDSIKKEQFWQKIGEQYSRDYFKETKYCGNFYMNSIENSASKETKPKTSKRRKTGKEGKNSKSEEGKDSEKDEVESGNDFSSMSEDDITEFKPGQTKATPSPVSFCFFCDLGIW